MDKLVRKAQKHVRDPILAAAGVQPGSSTAGLLSGALVAQGAAGGVVGTRLAQWRARRRTGLRVTPYMLMAATASDLFLFEAGMTWGVKKLIASWRFSAIDVHSEERTLTIRFEIRSPGSETPLVVEAEKNRRSRELARVISGASGVPAR